MRPPGADARGGGSAARPPGRHGQLASFARRERLRRRLDRHGLAYPGGIVAAAIDSTKPSVLPNVLVGPTVKNAMSFSTGLAAGSVPVSIVGLSQGVMRSMLFAKIGLISAALAGLGAAATVVAVGVGVAGRTAAGTTNSPRPSAGLIRSPPRSPPPQRPKTEAEEEKPASETELIVRSATNLKRIAKAIHAYLEANNLISRPRRS